MVNEELAQLARERVARHGAPPPAPRASLFALLGSHALLKAGGGLLIVLLFVARWHQSSCGCGSVESVLGQAKSSFKFEFKGDGNDLSSLFKGVSQTAEAFAGRCQEPTTTAICTAACWLGGNEIQMKVWSACFRAWLRGDMASGEQRRTSDHDATAGHDEV
jgi:hypothetical protein